MIARIIRAYTFPLRIRFYCRLWVWAGRLSSWAEVKAHTIKA